MQLSVRLSGIKNSHFRRDNCTTILRDALQRFGRRLRQVNLYLEDVNGPRGGIDKQCRCVLHLNRGAPIVIRDTDDNLNKLMHRVASRASHALSRELDRCQKRLNGRHNRRGVRQDPSSEMSDNSALNSPANAN